MSTGAADRPSAFEVAAQVPDPELPMVTLADLGILRGVQEDGDGVTVTLTPTYTGCPAIHEMSQDLRGRLEQAGYRDVRIRTELAPPWTTDRITADGRRKLAAAGIAPPHRTSARPAGTPVPLTLGVRRAAVCCPQCGSPQTRETAQFGPTPCTALYSCQQCQEPFAYVKDI